MDLAAQSSSDLQGDAAVLVGREEKGKETQPAYVSMVDPFLVEALQNPRHRLTILRMELDIQKFLESPDQPHFEFQQFPTSYLRLAAHRVAQHYDLQTMVLDNGVGGLGIRILATRKSECKFSVVRLSDVPAKESENGKLDQIKIVIRSRPRDLTSCSTELGPDHKHVRSVEDRKEEYDRARARIFSGSSSSESYRASPQIAADGQNVGANENNVPKKQILETERSICSREINNSSRVAIFKDREKDRIDPDYNRSYDRYFRSTANNRSFLTPFEMQKFQTPLVHYESTSPQHGYVPPLQAPLNYSNQVMSPYSALGMPQMPQEVLYGPWPTQSMVYAQSYDQLRHSFFQAPFQQPLSFDHGPKH